MVNAVYGAPERIAALAKDLVAHWENRRGQMTKFIESPGKAMIVGGTREICANLYSAIVALRPDWHSDELDKGVIKVALRRAGVSLLGDTSRQGSGGRCVD